MWRKYVVLVAAVVALTFADAAHGITFRNQLGTFVIRAGGTTAPGYVSRAVIRGRLVVDDVAAGAGYLNDPRFGGIGTFGWQASRDVGTDVLSGMPANAWPLDGRSAANGVTSSRLLYRTARTLGVEVTLGDPHDSTIARVVYSYTFTRATVRCRIRVTFTVPTGLPAFIKEPKVQFTARSRGLKVNRTRARSFLPGTDQGGAAAEQVIRFDRFTVRLDRSDFNRWKRAAATRPALAPVDSLGDTVQWACPFRAGTELIRRPGLAAALVTAWQGGRGPYDCEPLARRLVNESYVLAYTLG